MNQQEIITALERSLVTLQERKKCEAIGRAVLEKQETPDIAVSRASLNQQLLNQQIGVQHTMSLRIIEPTETINVEHPIFLLFGQPGVGKSSLGFSAENAILLNFDTEAAIARTVNRGRSINVLGLEELREFESGSPLLDPFSTIVIDPVGSCVNLMALDIVEKNPKYGRDGSLTLQGYGVLKSRFRTWMTRLRAMQKNILLVAHHKEDKNGDNVFVRPDITGSSCDEVMRLSDFVGFLYMSGKQRMLDFNPTESWFGKNPAQWPAWKVPAPEHARTFMAQLFQKGRESLSKASEASASVAQQVMDWQSAIESYTRIEEFNRAVPDIRGLNATLQPQVAKLIRTRAKACGFEYDVDRKVFYVVEPVKETVMAL